MTSYCYQLLLDYPKARPRWRSDFQRTLGLPATPQRRRVVAEDAVLDAQSSSIARDWSSVRLQPLTITLVAPMASQRIWSEMHTLSLFRLLEIGNLL
jgi:hypothetical protein